MISNLKKAYKRWKDEQSKLAQEQTALAIAEMAHSGQVRKRSGLLYIYHPLRVADYLRKTISDSHNDKHLFIQAALLHDAIEDSDGFVTADTLTYNGIEVRVVKAVELLSKNLHPGLTYYQYLDKLADDEIACTVKIADMIDNLSDRPTARQLVKYSTGLHYLASKTRTDRIFG